MRNTRMELHCGRLIRCYTERPRSVDAMFRNAVARGPDMDALVEGATRLSYSALDRRVDAVAGGLAERGVRAADRVAIMLPNSLEAVTRVLAIARLGAIIVPIGTRLRRPEIAHILGDSQPVALIYSGTYEAEIAGDSQWPSATMRFCVGDGAIGAPSSEELVGCGKPVAVANIAENDLFGILYTSGTTGRRKVPR